MPSKNKPAVEIEFEEENFDEFYDIESNRHIFHREQAERKYLLRRRIEDLREEKELRELDF